MIGVTGATGQLGRLVIQHLLNRTEASNIVALVRNPDNAQGLREQGVTIREADYDRPETLSAALNGVSKLLLISSNAVGQRMPHHQAVIDAAKAEGVELLAYTSILKADRSPLILAQEHKETEEALQASGLPTVLLRNGWYTENYTQSLGGVLQAGMVAGAAGEGVLNTATRNDLAEAAARVLTSADSEAGRVYELSGDEGFTLADYAREIARQTDRSIEYRALSEQDFTQMLVQIGLPEGFASILADAEARAAEGWLSDSGNDLSRLLGRPTTSLSEAVRDALA
ncbi:SDR family oxidoreductase [Saccharospirillum salsuginis]|uniref:NAD(P)-dependent oxidoreductase n=1 Tax=Saccharospirillum salsuginis TaxID=418750 RepID=A0A918K1X5_9GAMM|nr:SDR family oxidoreductase [Saccharospirillum salsuginis]GGX42738.1 NAD(P)-dependent oxidoreductase [Saccharospirillum salsuginis]